MIGALIPFRRRETPAGWRQGELAECFRVVDLLARTGLPVAIQTGLTDEGDPWALVIREDTGDVLMHLARIDGEFLVASAASSEAERGHDLRSVIDAAFSCDALGIVVRQKRVYKNDGLFLHPSTLMAAVIVTAWMHTEGSRARAEAPLATSTDRASGRSAPETPGASSSSLLLKAAASVAAVAAVLEDSAHISGSAVDPASAPPLATAQVDACAIADQKGEETTLLPAFDVTGRAISRQATPEHLINGAAGHIPPADASQSAASEQALTVVSQNAALLQAPDDQLFHAVEGFLPTPMAQVAHLRLNDTEDSGAWLWQASPSHSSSGETQASQQHQAPAHSGANLPDPPRSPHTTMAMGATEPLAAPLGRAAEPFAEGSPFFQEAVQLLQLDQWVLDISPRPREEDRPATVVRSSESLPEASGVDSFEISSVFSVSWDVSTGPDYLGSDMAPMAVSGSQKASEMAVAYPTPPPTAEAEAKAPPSNAQLLLEFVEAGVSIQAPALAWEMGALAGAQVLSASKFVVFDAPWLAGMAFMLMPNVAMVEDDLLGAEIRAALPASSASLTLDLGDNLSLKLLGVFEV